MMLSKLTLQDLKVRNRMGPKFSSQHPQGGPCKSVTLVSGDMTPFSDLCGHHRHIHGAQTYI